MSDKAIVDYLTKQLYIERNIVTYRSLSREFGIHVNIAKNELAKFHTQGPSLPHPVESFATYFVTGELHTSAKIPSQDDDDDNPYIDNEEDTQKKADSDFEYGGSEKVKQVQMSLVSEEKLEAIKAHYRKIYSVHVYSLTPSPLREPRLICTVAEQVREADSKRSVEMAAAIGRIISSEIQYPIAGPSKPKQVVVPKQPEVKPKVPPVTKAEKQQEKPKEEPKPTEKGKEKLKPAGSGKLDFFKPKIKETKKEESSKTSVAKTFFSVPKKEQKDVAATTRGTKRKSIATKSESEDDTGSTSTVPPKPVSKSKAPIKAELGRAPSTSNISSKPAAKSKGELGRTSSTSGPKIKGAVILSDEESDARVVSRRKGKSRVLTKVASDVDSEAENEARALMDIDDEQVTKASHGHSKPQDLEERDGTVAQLDANEDGDVEMEDEELPKPKPKQRKPRKTVPVGRNGLKKKKVIRSRTTADEKGYMVTEDYSSYESVEEAEAEAPAAKGKGKGKAKPSEEEKTGAKGGRKPKGQASLASFFGPPKSKR